MINFINFLPSIYQDNLVALHSAAFRQENLAMKRENKTLNLQFRFHQLWQTAKPLLPKQHISQTSDQTEPSNFALNQRKQPSLVRQSAPSNFALYVIKHVTRAFIAW